jgi:hypothetical protein
MRLNRIFEPRLWSLAFALALSGPALRSPAQPIDWVNGFDGPVSAVPWLASGTPEPLLTWEAAVDACGDTNSGSLSFIEHFTGATNEMFYLIGPFMDASNVVVAVNPYPYTHVAFDLRVDPISTLTAQGDFGPLDIYGMTSGGSMDWVGTFRIPALATNWIHVNMRFPNTFSFQPLWAIFCEMWPSGQSNTVALHLDNFGLQGCNCAPPPHLGMERAAPGLHLVPPINRPVDERQSIYTKTPSFSWMDAAGPVTYSITLAQFPSGDWPHDPGYQAHMFLVPQRDIPNGPGDSDIDWSATNVVYLQIASLAAGGARAQFMFKTNQASASVIFTNTNPALGPVGLLASLDAASALGTWRVTFSANTNVSLSAPDGTATAFSMPAPVAALFRNPLHAYFGVAGNSPYNLGTEAILSRIQIIGTAAPLDETFSAPALAPEVWDYAAAEPTGVIPVPAGSWLWLEWLGTQRGYLLQASPNLLPGSWQNTELAGQFVVWGGPPRLLLPPPGTGDSPTMFFRIAPEPVHRCGQSYPPGW